MSIETPVPITLPPEQAPTQNAADAWNELFLELDDIPYIEHELGYQIPYYELDDWNDNAHVLREQMSPLVERAREISAMEHCDWELDYSQGLDLLLPQFGHLRQIQKMLVYSMHGEMDRGNTASALSDMNSMFGITKHNAETETLIGALVATSSFNMAKMNEHIIDSATDAGQLEAILASVEEFEAFDSFGIRENVGKERELILNWLKKTENPDFALFQSITGEQVDTSNLNMDEEIERYSFAMGKMESIFQMTDKDAALAVAEQLDAELKDGGLGFLATALSPSSKNLLISAFKGEEMVSELKQLLQNKIDMIRNPNSATYFLRAVEAYNETDAIDRFNAVNHGDFTIFEEPFTLFTKACSLPPKQITLASTPETPHWIAPLYSLALDCISRGTTSDRLAIMEFIGHLSQQNRFAASILAAKLFNYDWGSTPEPEEPHLRAAFERAKKQIPSADEFMLHGSAESERQRLLDWYDMEESWDPNDANTLAMTLTLAKLKGVDSHNPEAWKLLIQAVGIPDTHPSFLFAEEDYNPELIEYLKLPQEESFDEMLENFSTLIGHSRYSEINSRGR